MMNEYTITIKAPDMPNPQDVALYLRAEVLGIKKVRDDLVTASQLAKITNLSRSTIINKCRHLNVGTKGKALYSKTDAINALSTTKKRGVKRQN